MASTGSEADMGDVTPDAYDECARCGKFYYTHGAQELSRRERHAFTPRKPTRTRIHVGWRVVRMRDGVREWSSGNGRWTRMPSLAITLSPRHQWLANDLAGEYGGRVCKVFLSYGRRR